MHLWIKIGATRVEITFAGGSVINIDRKVTDAKEIAEIDKSLAIEIANRKGETA